MLNREKLHTEHLPARLSRRDIENIAVGACFLGGGGGGSLEAARYSIEAFYNEEKDDPLEVEVASVESLKPHKYGLVTAIMGAPEVIKDVDRPERCLKAVHMIKHFLHQQNPKAELSYIVPAEVGPVSMTIACLVAAKLGIKVVDGDGAGRSVPTLPCLTFSTTAGVLPIPIAVANKHHNVCFFATLTPFEEQSISPVLNQWSEKTVPLNPDLTSRLSSTMGDCLDHFIRPLLAEKETGNFAGLATWLMDGRQIEKAVRIRSTLKLAWLLGARMEEIGTATQMIETLDELGVKGARILFENGTFEDAATKPLIGGTTGQIETFDHGEIYISSDTGRCVVHYLNETLYISGEKDSSHPFLYTAPDVIAYFVEPSAPGAKEQKVFTNADLVGVDGKLKVDLKNRKVFIIGRPAHKELTSDTLIIGKFRELLHSVGYDGYLMPVDTITPHGCRHGRDI